MTAVFFWILGDLFGVAERRAEVEVLSLVSIVGKRPTSAPWLVGSSLKRGSLVDGSALTAPLSFGFLHPFHQPVALHLTSRRYITNHPVRPQYRRSRA
jgi:hypothetical protein